MSSRAHSRAQPELVAFKVMRSAAARGFGKALETMPHGLSRDRADANAADGALLDDPLRQAVTQDGTRPGAELLTLERKSTDQA